MHPGAQHRIAPLQQGAEGHLGARREVAHGAQVALFWPTQGGWGWGKARVDDMETQIFQKYLGNISWMTCWMMEIQMTVLFFSVSVRGVSGIGAENIHGIQHILFYTLQR